MKLHSAAKVAAYTKAGLWGAKTWPQLLADHVASMPNRTSVVDPPNLLQITGARPQRMTWAELDHRVDAIAAKLLGSGVRAGDVVGLQLPNSVDLSASYIALASIGAITTPLPVQYRGFELVQMGRLSNMKAFITAGKILGRNVEDIAQTLRAQLGLTNIFAFGTDLPKGVTPLGLPDDDSFDGDSLVAYRSGLDEDPNNAVTICWTSGTESTPKGVPRCANDWYRMALSAVDGPRLTLDSVLLNTFPMVNMGGIAGMFVPWLITGATLIHHHPFDSGIYFKQIADEKVTYTLAAPATLIRALDLPSCTAEALESLQAIGSGSAPLPPSMIVAWKERFNIDIINCFGSNEGISLNSNARTVPDPTDRATLFPRFGSPTHVWESRSAEGVESRLINMTDGSIITQAGIPGELRLKGPGIFAGYLEGTSTKDPFDEDGFYCTGDVFKYVADASGDIRFFQYVDRAKDMIIRGGMKISPAELEVMIVAHPKVVEVAMIGRPDPVLGERVEAVVVVEAGETLTLDELLDFLRTLHIATYKLPEFLRIVDALPRNPVGKVLKRDLRQLESIALNDAR